MQLGVNITAATAGVYATTALEHSLLQARTHGFDTVTLTPTWYMSTPRASDLAPDPVLTAGDAALEHAIAAARRQGLSVAIRPLVDLPGQYRWRSLIDPEDRDRWWERYGAMIEHYAGLAHRGRAVTLVIGSELEGLTGAPADDARWRALTAAVRRRFAGALTYTTGSLEDPGVVRFWDELDYVGITLRPQLAHDERAAGDPAESAAWAPYADALEQLHGRWSRPVVVTELGFRSSERALSDPSAWDAADAPDFDLQALAYDSAYRLFEQLPWLAGVHWWEWPADLESAAQDATGHCPYRKPAAGVATRWNRRLSSRREPPFVSVVVPVRNGADTIQDCVASLLAQQYPFQRREIIVVDNASTDATRSIIAALPVISAPEPKVGRSHARNRGVAEARGEIVAFVDSDCVAAVDWLRELTAAFEREPVSAVAGEILAQPPVTAVQRFTAQREAQWQRRVTTTLPHPFRFAITANLAIRREVFDHIGGFDPRFPTAEDSDFGWRFFAAGLAMSYCPTATVSHRLRRDAWQFIRQQEGFGYGRALLRKRYRVPGRYGLPANREVVNAAQALGRILLGRRRRTRDELPFALYELLRLVSLRAGSARRELVNVFVPYSPT